MSSNIINRPYYDSLYYFLQRILRTFRYNQKSEGMKNLIRGILAFIGAKKIGGGKCGCFGFVVVFIILYWLLGYVFKVF